MTLFRRLSLATTLTTLGVIGVGGLVRATHSGLGCPEWPKCHGRWFPPIEYHALIEWSHRSIGAIAITLLLVTAIVAVIKHRADRIVSVPTLVAAFLILVQAGLGAIVVASGTSPELVTFHIATAMLLIGLLVFVTTVVYARGRNAVPVERGVARLTIGAAGSVFALILIGAYVRAEGAGLAFPDWPLMNGSLLPELGGGATANYLHRLAAVAVGVLGIVLLVRATRARPRDRALVAFVHAAALAFVAQAVVGGIQVLTDLAAPPVVTHVFLAATLWALLVAAATLANLPAARPSPQEAPGADAPETPRSRRAWRDSVRAYVQLTKPRIVVLLLITTVPTMMLAARGVPSPWLMFATVFGGALAAGAANTINMYFDRDIDEVMGRTRARPLPAHRVEPVRALAFALVLAAASFWFMTVTVNLLAATLTQSAILFYVFVYTLGLKRSTPQNIVIGGAAGAVPVLVGWAAVTGRVGVEAFILFAVIFFWTPPHFWALAMRFAGDYERAGVPMLPVVAGARETQRQILGYSVVTVAVTLALTPVARMGPIYLAAAGILGAVLVRSALVLFREGTPKAAMGLFKYSITYLALLFAAVGVDAVVGPGA